MFARQCARHCAFFHPLPPPPPRLQLPMCLQIEWQIYVKEICRTVLLTLGTDPSLLQQPHRMFQSALLDAKPIAEHAATPLQWYVLYEI